MKKEKDRGMRFTFKNQVKTKKVLDSMKYSWQKVVTFLITFDCFFYDLNSWRFFLLVLSSFQTCLLKSYVEGKIQFSTWIMPKFLQSFLEHSRTCRRGRGAIAFPSVQNVGKIKIFRAATRKYLRKTRVFRAGKLAQNQKP